MKYEEIIGLSDYFQPVYDLEGEIECYWKQFIPNEKFLNILSETINSLESSEPKEKKSIWLQGTYGTGKSHATAVVKHLLSDKLDEIDDFIENLREDQIKFKVRNFRKSKRVFSVVLKGTSSISDNRTFALTIEKAVRNALKREKVELSIKTDFDKTISKLKINEINWEEVFKGTELEFYGTKEDLISRLQQGDLSILTKIEDALSQKNIHIFTEDITRWLIEVREELKNKGIADYLVIYWDEFTGILELPKSGLILTQLQNVAELSISKGIYLFVVVHRKPYQASNISKEDVEKILARFKVLDYSMEPITTYHIISFAIRKKDERSFLELKNRYISLVKSPIEEISEREGIYNQRSLESLFPIHPYTAYLATFIARNIGSTERSIFSFLYDERYGFKKFVKENPNTSGRIFLTADYLWDFFYEEFERMEDEKVYIVMEKFKLYKDVLREKGDEYLSVFKGLLLLNLLFRFVEVKESSLVAPSERNIANLFAGVINRESLAEILSFIDANQIVTKTPDNLYIITGSGLPLREVETEKNNLESQYSTPEKLLLDRRWHKDELEKIISAPVNRDVELEIMSANLKEYLIRENVKKMFREDYKIHVCLFLGKSNQELHQIKNILKSIANSDEFKNVIFVVSEAILDESIFNKFIEYKARATVAYKHSYLEERDMNESYANKTVDNWINQIKSGYVEWFLQDRSERCLMGELGKKINEELSKKIFFYGQENIDGLQQNANIWTRKRSKSAVEIFLFANQREDIENKTSKGPQRYLRDIIKNNRGEYVVDADLKIKDNISQEHPLKKMHLEIKKVLEKKREEGKVFNLGDTLKFLTKPPYGLYPNMVNMAAIGLLMQEYVGKLFEARTGVPIQKELMRDKIMALFDYWDRGACGEQLEVRFGTKEEEELIRVLKDIFGLSEDVKDLSLTNVRWKIREWIKEQGFPMWALNFGEDIGEEVSRAINAISKLIQLSDEEITHEETKEFLDSISNAAYDLQFLITQIKHKRPLKEFFIKWLINIEGVEILAEEVEEVISYIKSNLQEEVASWVEDRVREKVKDWYTKKLQKNQEQLERELEKLRHNEGNVKEKADGLEPCSFVSQERVENIKKQIWSTSEKSVREILTRLVDEFQNIHPDIIATIEKYLVEIQ